jgi:hypothetical protein
MAEARRVVGYYGREPNAFPRTIFVGQPADYSVPCLLLGKLATDIAWTATESQQAWSSMPLRAL